MTSLKLYLWILFINLSPLFALVGIFSLIAIFILLLICEGEKIEFRQRMVKYFIALIFSALFFFGVYAAIPSEKQLVAIYVIPSLYNSQLINKLPIYITQWITNELNDKSV